MSGWNPTRPQTVTAKETPQAADRIHVPGISASEYLEIMFVIRNEGPDTVHLTWGREDAGIPDPLPSLVVPAPSGSGPEFVQFGPFSSQQQYWYVTKTGADQNVVVDVYTRHSFRRR